MDSSQKYEELLEVTRNRYPSICAHLSIHDILSINKMFLFLYTIRNFTNLTFSFGFGAQYPNAKCMNSYIPGMYRMDNKAEFKYILT